MSTQAPQLDKGEMAAAERANLRLVEQIMVLMVKALREYAKHYPPKLQQTLSDPNAETKVDISVGNEKLLSTTLGADGKVKETQTNKITDWQAQELQKALCLQQGERLDPSGKMQDIRVLANGILLFEAKNGKVIQNDLPPDLQKALAAIEKPKLLSVSLSANSPNEATSRQQSSHFGAERAERAPGVGQSNAARTKPIPDVAQNQSNPPTLQEATAKTNPILDFAPTESNPPTLGQEQLNRALITEAKKSLDRLAPDQGAGNRQWNHDKYTVTQKDGITSVYVAETNTTIRTNGNEITGNARQKDVEALSTVNATIDQQLGKPAVKQTGAEL